MKKRIYFNLLFAFILFPTFIGLVSGQSLTYPIVGTGVTLCYGNSSPITCPTNTTDAFYGQFPGTVPSYQDNGNGTISDLNTGLMWVQSRGTKISWDSAFIMAAQCTTGGYNDWRVPSIKELYSLIHFNGKSGASAPQCIAYLDTNYFEMAYGNLANGERIIDAQDWSTAVYTSLTMAGDTTVFGVNFVDGRIKGYPKYQPPTNTTPQRMYVRYVRGNTNYGINDFTDNGNNTITDNATGLMWSKDDSGTGMNWQDALAYAQTKNSETYLGYTDWRLPNAKELQSIVDYSRSLDATGSAAIDPVFNCTAITNEGGNIDYPWFWTSTTHLDNMCGVYVTFGEALGYMKMPPTAAYYTLVDVHGAGAQRSDPKSGSVSSYYLGVDQGGNPVYGLGPQGDVIRINNYVRLVRDDSSVTGMNQNENGNYFNIYPNPFSDICNISLNISSQNITVEIYNSIGSKVRTLEICDKNSIEINLEDLPDGIYIMNVSTGNYSKTRKIIKL